MSTFLRLFIIASAIFFAYLLLTRPRQLRMIGRKARLVGLIYAATIVISAALRIYFG